MQVKEKTMNMLEAQVAINKRAIEKLREEVRELVDMLAEKERNAAWWKRPRKKL